MQTQYQIVKEKLLKEGEISNLWAIQNYIWRLGAIIYDLRQDGMHINGEFIKNVKGRKTNVYRYYL